jgi:hypothetical protein
MDLVDGDTRPDDFVRLLQHDHAHHQGANHQENEGLIGPLIFANGANRRSD